MSRKLKQKNPLQVEFEELLSEMRPHMPSNCLRPRKKKFFQATDQDREAVLKWLRLVKSKYFDPLKKVIDCMPADRWQYYTENGLTDLPEYRKRVKLEKEFRQAWNLTLPELLRREKSEQETSPSN